MSDSGGVGVMHIHLARIDSPESTDVEGTLRLAEIRHFPNKCVFGRGKRDRKTQRPGKGRETVDIFVDETTVSRTHCKVSWDEPLQSLVLEDLVGKKGTFLNGARCKHGCPLPLGVGDRIRVGKEEWLVVPEGTTTEGLTGVGGSGVSGSLAEEEERERERERERILAEEEERERERLRELEALAQMERERREEAQRIAEREAAEGMQYMEAERLAALASESRALDPALLVSEGSPVLGLGMGMGLPGMAQGGVVSAVPALPAVQGVQGVQGVVPMASVVSGSVTSGSLPDPVSLSGVPVIPTPPSLPRGLGIRAGDAIPEAMRLPQTAETETGRERESSGGIQGGSLRMSQVYTESSSEGEGEGEGDSLLDKDGAPPSERTAPLGQWSGAPVSPSTPMHHLSHVHMPPSPGSAPGAGGTDADAGAAPQAVVPVVPAPSLSGRGGCHDVSVGADPVSLVQQVLERERAESAQVSNVIAQTDKLLAGVDGDTDMVVYQTSEQDRQHERHAAMLAAVGQIEDSDYAQRQSIAETLARLEAKIDGLVDEREREKERQRETASVEASLRQQLQEAQQGQLELSKAILRYQEHMPALPPHSPKALIQRERGEASEGEAIVYGKTTSTARVHRSVCKQTPSTEVVPRGLPLGPSAQRRPTPTRRRRPSVTAIQASILGPVSDNGPKESDPVTDSLRKSAVLADESGMAEAGDTDTDIPHFGSAVTSTDLLARGVQASPGFPRFTPKAEQGEGEGEGEGDVGVDASESDASIDIGIDDIMPVGTGGSGTERVAVDTAEPIKYADQPEFSAKYRARVYTLQRAQAQRVQALHKGQEDAGKFAAIACDIQKASYVEFQCYPSVVDVMCLGVVDKQSLTSIKWDRANTTTPGSYWWDQTGGISYKHRKQ
ncbi:hypothetical protein KIPB_005542, partial [Kipferlia bialata]|eukprot:g5542.t1